MGLYLCVFKNDIEINGVEVGMYADFSYFRDTVLEKLENRQIGSMFPVLMLHSDCDGIWSVEEARLLEKELYEIEKRFKEMPPIDFNSEWQKDVAKTFGIKPNNLLECFIDIDGISLFERLKDLCNISQKMNEPILFQ
jgi:hypothetical protein